MIINFSKNINKGKIVEMIIRIKPIFILSALNAIPTKSKDIEYIVKTLFL